MSHNLHRLPPQQKATQPSLPHQLSGSGFTELRRRINATRFPERKRSRINHEAQLATIQKTRALWATEYDWQKCETRLERLAEFYH
jgi:hypothetical protein